MYRKFAEERESEGSFEGSIEYWAKSLEAARSAGDQVALGQACYRLGKAYTELEDPTRFGFSCVSVETSFLKCPAIVFAPPRGRCDWLPRWMHALKQRGAQ